MVSSAAVSLFRGLLTRRFQIPKHNPTGVVCSTRFIATDTDATSSPPPAAAAAESDAGSVSELELEDDPDPSTGSWKEQKRTLSFQRPLENGLDQGVYKAILVGRVGQKPVQKRLKSGRSVTLFSLGTGGIRNNRRPLENEDPKEYANRCAVQWHRVSVYPERLASLAMNEVTPGSIMYLEGNLETKIFADPISGLVRQIREIAVRRDGRLIFLGQGDEQSSELDLRAVGYF